MRIQFVQYVIAFSIETFQIIASGIYFVPSPNLIQIEFQRYYGMSDSRAALTE